MVPKFVLVLILARSSSVSSLQGSHLKDIELSNRDVSARPNHCVKIVTGTGGSNNGNMEIEVDTGTDKVTKPSEHYAKGTIVMEDCFRSVVHHVSVTNPTTDAWAGSIELSTDGGATYVAMECVDCTSG